MRTVKRCAFVFFAVVAVHWQASGALPQCQSGANNTVSCQGVTNQNPDFCQDGSVWSFCSGQCYDFFGLGVSNVPICTNTECAPPWVPGGPVWTAEFLCECGD